MKRTNIFLTPIYLILINSIFVMIICCRFFVHLTYSLDFKSLLFIITSIIGHAFILVLSLSPFLFIISLCPVHKVYRFISSLLFTLFLSLLFIDIIVFSQYKFHINLVLAKMILRKDIVSFHYLSWIYLFVGILIIFLIEFQIVKYIDKRIHILKKFKIGRISCLIIFICTITYNALHIWAAAYDYRSIILSKQYLPFFSPATANSFLTKQGFISPNSSVNTKTKIGLKGTIQYPLKDIVHKPITSKANIILIVIDSWRFDTFNSKNTPHLYRFIKDGLIFNMHIASGNESRTGIFSLFYGLPGTYWHTFLDHQQSPILLDRLTQLGYDIGVFSAARLDSPEFHKTVFSKIKPLRNGSKGKSPSERDLNLTQDWLKWYKDRLENNSPKFSFLFYNSPHGYDFPSDYPQTYKPWLKNLNYLKLNNSTDSLPFLNRYRNSVHYVDSLLHKVITYLEETKSLDNTLFVVTGDHGQEANDNKLNFWGHSGNFTNAQVQVPFILKGPGITQALIRKNSSIFNRSLTSHEDIAPTLLKNYLGLISPIEFYSTGFDLLSKNLKLRKWVISSSYSKYAIITPDNILEVDNKAGFYQLLDKRNRVLKNQEINFSYLKEAMNKMTAFQK